MGIQPKRGIERRIIHILIAVLVAATGAVRGIRIILISVTQLVLCHFGRRHGACILKPKRHLASRRQLHGQSDSDLAWVVGGGHIVRKAGFGYLTGTSNPSLSASSPEETAHSDTRGLQPVGQRRRE